jgi:hypothetical protein
MLTLWDLLDPIIIRIAPAKRPAPPARTRPPLQVVVAPPANRVLERPSSAQVNPAVARPAPARTPAKRPRAGVKRKGSAGEAATSEMQAKYDAVVKLMLETHRIRIRKWRTSMSGIAWYVTYRDGTRVNLIESPRPKGPMSAAIFLHEIGHHAIGFNVYRPRCLEEYHAWRWSLEAMEQHGLNITDAVRLRMHRSLWYAVQKAKRRGIKSVPEELTPFLEKPSFARRRKRAA